MVDTRNYSLDLHIKENDSKIELNHMMRRCYTTHQSYDGHWRLTWLLTSGPVGLVEVRASWSGHPR